MIDWGLGQYESTAAELEPVAEHVVSLARVGDGERMLDLACGTGNAALHCARSGAAVVGLDASARLIEVARGRFAAEGLEATLVVGDVQALPFEADSFDVAVSVFGIIFAADAELAFAEAIRVLAPGGRALFSVWMPEGAINKMARVFGEAMSAAVGAAPARFAWHDTGAISALATRHSLELQIHQGELSIVSSSPEAYFAANEERHPLSVAGRPMLERAGSYEAVREKAIDALRQGNEDPGGFRVRSPYRIIEVRFAP